MATDTPSGQKQTNFGRRSILMTGTLKQEHCKYWFVDLANILLHRLYVANLICYENGHNIVFVIDVLLFMQL